VILLTLTDNIYGSITSVHGNVVSTTCTVTRTIAVGASYTCSFVGRFTGNAGAVQTDIVTATARDDENNRVSATDDATVRLTDVLPSINVDKTATPLTLGEPGGTFTFGVRVSNTSVEPITLTNLTDDVYGSITTVQGNVVSTTCAIPQTIAVGATYACSFVGRFTGNAGAVQTDVVTATARDDENNPATDTDDATVRITDVLPVIAVDKTATPLTLPEPGGTFTFGVTVTNRSVEPVTLTTLVDDVYGDLDGQGDCDVPQTLAIGASYSCSFTGDFTGNAGDPQTDTITASATDDDGNTATQDDDATVTLTDVPSSIEVTKTADPVEVDEPGDTVTFSVTVHNTSTVDTVTIDSLSDDIHGDLDGQGDCAVPFDLAPDESVSCTFTADVTGNAGDVETDTVTASGTDDDGTPVSDDDDASVTVLDVLPGITLDKSAAPLTMAEPGGDFTFSLTVTNDSVEPVTLTDLTDDVYGDVTVVAGDITSTSCAVPQTIAVGGSYACAFTATFTGTAEDAQTDVVTATAADDEGNPAIDDDDATVELTDVLPAITVDKAADPVVMLEPGGEFTFSVTVTNDSVEPVELTRLVDDIYGDLDGQGDCAVPQTIAVGGSYACSFPGDFTGTDGDTQTDVVTATAEDDEGNQAVDDDDATVSLADVLPGITVDKTASPLTLPERGGDFTFGVTITNDSVEPIDLVSLVDDVYGDLDGQGDCALPQTIDVGDSYSCEFTGSFTGNAGDTQTDTITATAEDDEGNQAVDDDDATVTLTDLPSSIEVTKTADPVEVDEPGDTVTFSITVHNTSPVDVVTIDTLDDDVHGDLDGQGDCAVPVDLAPDESYSCSFTADVLGNAGYVEIDTVTASGTDDDGVDVSDEDDATVTVLDVLPAITVDKTAAPLTLPEPGGDFTFSLTVTNDSVEPVTLTSLVDDIYGDLDGQGDCAVPQTIAIGDSYSCSFTGAYAANAGDSQTDTITATAEDDEGNETTDADDAMVELTDVLPAITVDKTASPTTMPEPGGDVTFSISVTNDSTVESVELTSLDDDVYGDLTSMSGDIVSTTCVLPQTIAIGDTYACEFVAPVDGTAEQSPYVDVVTATAEDDEGNQATDTDDASVELTDEVPAISTEKTADPETMPEPGGDFRFRIRVSNDGVEPVTLTSLVDDVYGDLDGQGDCAVPQTIAAGDAYSCSFEGSFTGNAGDTQTDVVTATAEDDEGNVTSDDDDATVELTQVSPDISMTKTPKPTTVVAPGGMVRFRVTVTNESTFEPITLDSLLDSVYGDLNGQGSCVADGTVVIAPGDTYRCSFKARVSGKAGTTHRNTIRATAHDDDAPAPLVLTARARAVVKVIAPDIQLPPTDMAP